VRVLIYQNPDAGHELKAPGPLVGELQRAGHDVEWKNAKKERITGPMTAGFDLVVAAGGDGNVGRTARQLIGLPVPVAVLPLGTANNLATVLGARPHDLVDRIAGWAIRPFDAGIVEWTGHADWFFEGFGLGAFAETARMLTARDAAGGSPANRDAELARDIAALCERVETQEGREFEIRTDDRTVQERMLMVEVLNIGIIGPKVALAPQADPSDGALDLVWISEDRREELVAFLRALRDGREERSPFEAVRTQSVRITSTSRAWAHVDGATAEVPGGSEIQVRMRPRAINVLTGAGAHVT
jgi:diacylglycerol kinase family enzyme